MSRPKVPQHCDEGNSREPKCITLPSDLNSAAWQIGPISWYQRASWGPWWLRVPFRKLTPDILMKRYWTQTIALLVRKWVGEGEKNETLCYISSSNNKKQLYQVDKRLFFFFFSNLLNTSRKPCFVWAKALKWLSSVQYRLVLYSWISIRNAGQWTKDGISDRVPLLPANVRKMVREVGRRGCVWNGIYLGIIDIPRESGERCLYIGMFSPSKYLQELILWVMIDEVMHAHSVGTWWNWNLISMIGMGI